ncbi:hypothetical protein ABD72_04805 [Brevibacillus laterosporus]|nr:hypothetical protein [Brevibacillus laterosporus]TPH19046.1 hypothetical protein EGH09_06945 [Brevibacillus laterosporus]
MDIFLRLLILIGIGLILKAFSLLFINRSNTSSKRAYYYQLLVGAGIIILGNLVLHTPIMNV